MFELVTRVLCDLAPETAVAGAYLFGQTNHNQVSVLQVAPDLLAQSLASKILLMGTGPLSGYPGFETWRDRLLDHGVAAGQIERVEIDDPTSLNTLIEAQALIRFAKRKGYNSLMVVAAPFHQVRAYMTTVTVALREYPQVPIYSYPGLTLPWHEEVLHSQGTTRGTRRDLIQGELERINRYQAKGDLASFEEVVRYLDRRDLLP
jgi:hypothetical protein